MEIIITIFLMLFSLIFRKSRAIAASFFIFMWSLWGWNSWNGDYDAYKIEYEDSIWLANSKTYEAGYSILNSFFLRLGFDFQTYMIVLSFFVLLAILIFSFKYSNYPALFSSMYFVIFIIEFVFTRTYLVHSMMLMAFLVAFSRIKFYRLWFVAIVLLASTIHGTAIIFLVFVIPLFTDEVFDLKKALGLSLFLLISSILLFSYVIIPLLGEQYIVKLSFYNTGGGFSTVFFAHLIIVLLVYFYFNWILNKSDEIPPHFRDIYILVINVNLVSLSFLSLYYHVPYFARILRFVFTFDLVFLLSALFFMRADKIRGLLYCVIFLIFSSILVMFFKSTLSLTFYPLYKCNLIWGEEYYVPDFDYGQ